MMGLFPLASATTPTFTLPPLEEDAPGAERLLGTLGRQALGVPAFSLLKPEPPEDTELPPLPDLGELDLSVRAGMFPSVDVGVYSAPPEEEDSPPSPSALRKGVEEWRAAAEPIAGPSRTQVRPLVLHRRELTPATHVGRCARAPPLRVASVRGVPRRVC